MRDYHSASHQGFSSYPPFIFFGCQNALENYEFLVLPIVLSNVIINVYAPSSISLFQYYLMKYWSIAGHQRSTRNMSSWYWRCSESVACLPNRASAHSPETTCSSGSRSGCWWHLTSDNGLPFGRMHINIPPNLAATRHAWTHIFKLSKACLHSRCAPCFLAWILIMRAVEGLQPEGKLLPEGFIKHLSYLKEYQSIPKPGVGKLMDPWRRESAWFQLGS